MNSSPQATKTPTAEPDGRTARRHIADYDRLIDDLAYTYAGAFSRDSIAQAVADARAALEPTTIPDFLPIPVSRFAREQLTAAAQADGRIAKPVPELLCICVHNADRARVRAAAAEIGYRPDGHRSLGRTRHHPHRGLPETAHQRRRPRRRRHRHHGCGDTCPIYPSERYLDWDVPDPNDQPIDRVRDIRDDLQARLTTLLRDLNI
jgi:arsenate reductase (thioredoxin)